MESGYEAVGESCGVESGYEAVGESYGMERGNEAASHHTSGQRLASTLGLRHQWAMKIS